MNLMIGIQLIEIQFKACAMKIQTLMNKPFITQDLLDSELSAIRKLLVETINEQSAHTEKTLHEVINSHLLKVIEERK